MMQVFVCVGSSCRLKGSYLIISKFQELIRQHGLEDRVELKASFCLGRCTEGVAVKVDETFVDGVSISNAEQKFREAVLSIL